MPLNFRYGRPTIGVLAGWQYYNIATSLNYLMPVYKGIIESARTLDCNLLLGCGLGGGEESIEQIRPAWPANSPDCDFVPIGAWNTDGLIIFTPLHSNDRSAYVQRLQKSGFPVLFIGSGEEGPTLTVDNAGGVRDAVSHLMKHGHRQIAFIAGSPDDLKGDTGERLDAFKMALEENGLLSDPRCLAFGWHIYDGGYTAMRHFLDSGAQFTAVLASNDEMALGAMQALKEAGREIPEDVAVIGFDNRLEDTAQKPSLSSVHIPLHHIGERALQSLLGRILHRKKLPDVVRVETRLVARESCGCGGYSSFYYDFQGDTATGFVRPANLSTYVMRQAHNLEENVCHQFCEQLIESFSSEIQNGNQGRFVNVLMDILVRTTETGDDADIWQDAVNLIGGEYKKHSELTTGTIQEIDELLDLARHTISSHSQRQHRLFSSNLGWISNRLSLLTGGLLTSLDEDQIYKVLRKHLPILDINRAFVAFYETDEDDPTAWSVLQNVFTPEQPKIRFRSRLFPPRGLISDGVPFQLVAIPFAFQSGQSGYAIFDSSHIDLYGAVVQQIGGALNTAHLYREATTGRRMAEEANRLKSRFLSVIGHELRTPLNLIVGLSEIVLNRADEDETVIPDDIHRDIERVHTYSQHLGGLIGDVLDLATSDAGQLRLNNDFVDLGQALAIIAESGKQLAADKGLTWEAKLPESGPWVWGDRMRLRQITLNLINNAVKFTEHGGVSLRLETEPDSVTVLVSDTGLGISAEDQQIIFDEFRQADNTVAFGYGGLGLGLAISKRLVELHGGSIQVQSSGEPGAGSTFSFKLPTLPEPLGFAPHQVSLSTTIKSVLVITTQPDLCEPLFSQLNQRGIRVIVHSIDTSAEFKPQFYDSIPDVVLIDANVASSAGWEAIKKIKRNPVAHDIPVLFFNISQDAAALFEVNYLTKPIEPEALTKVLDQHWLLLAEQLPARTILVVDDEPNTLDLNARIVKSHSAANNVVKARNGHEAIKILESESVDLVLLDLQMPELDGFGVLKYIREHENTRKIPVIVVTGKVLSEIDMARLNQGVTTVLEKGLFSLEETVEHINTALTRKRRLSGEAQRLVRKSMAFIHEHYSESITRSEIAQFVGVSEDHLTFCFRQELGATPIKYLQRYRIHQARQLLQSTDQSISQIALEVGFSDSGYFSRIFRRIIGKSPEAFRRS